MQITETLSDGLRREFKIVIPADTIDTKVDAKLIEISGQVNLPGFRPGKVPMKILRQRFSKNVLGEVLETTVNETTQSTLEERELKPALQPKIEVTSFDEGGDLEYTVALEILPEVDAVELSDISLERPVSPVTDEEVEESLQRLLDQAKNYEDEEGREAQDEDQVVIDFDGSVDGEKRPGMQAEGSPLVIGSGAFIPGFEEQLIGKKAGDETTVTVTFPEDYGVDDLSGREAVFEVKIQAVRAPVAAEANDEFAGKYGFDSMDSLKADMRERHEGQLAGVSRERAKRALLDALAERVSFGVPEGMVDVEFEQIWTQVDRARKEYAEKKEAGEEDLPVDEDMEKPEDEVKAEYRSIAERRVRLGLLLADIGTKSSVEVTQEELQRAVIDEARKYPGQEQQIFKMFQENPQILESIRAPLYENKVVDLILEQVNVTDKEVGREELMRDPDEEGDAAEETKQEA